MGFRFAYGRPPAAALEGIQIPRDDDTFGFGGGQTIVVDGEALLNGSDPRKDGYAAGL